MFDSGLAEFGAVEAAAALTASLRIQCEVECRQLELAGHWADLHAAVADQGIGPGREQLRQLGGAGTPEVAEFAAAEIGPLLGTSSAAGRHLLADALDLRHRLPRLWDRVRAGQVRAWKARKVAAATRHLTAEQAAGVDAAVAAYVTSLPWGRLESLLAAKVIEADPAGADLAAQEAAARRFVRAGRSNVHGLRLLVAQADAVDVVWFLAMVDRIADILAVRGDRTGAEERRAAAIGILAQPALALQLLCDHEGDLPDAPAEREPWRRETTAGGADGHPADTTAGRPWWRRHRPGWVNQPGQPTDSEAPPTETNPPDPADHDRTPPEDVHAADAPVDAAAAAVVPAPCDSAKSSESEKPEPEDLEPEELAPEELEAEDGERHRSVRIAPPEIDPARLRPPVMIHVHLAAAALAGGPGYPGVARIEDVGPVTLRQVRRFFGDRANIIIQPVLDPAGQPPVDGWEIPARLRDAMHLLTPADTFPYGISTARRHDLDHTIPYRPLADGGPPGQTGIGRLGPMIRYHHRVKTHGRWRVVQPDPGIYMWRSPTRNVYLVNADGTHPLGGSRFATAVWHTALRGASASDRLDAAGFDLMA